MTLEVEPRDLEVLMEGAPTRPPRLPPELVGGRWTLVVDLLVVLDLRELEPVLREKD